MTAATDFFSDWAPIYRKLGYWPRPIKPGTKGCRLPNWTRPDSSLSEAELKRWLYTNGTDGIGLLMGSPFPDGTTLAALDVDHDAYVPIAAAVLRSPVNGRIVKKGIAYFVRIRGTVPYQQFSPSGQWRKTYGQVAELHTRDRLCVIPPTIHPDTGQRYRWIGKPLHEVEFTELPVVESPGRG